MNSTWLLSPKSKIIVNTKKLTLYNNLILDLPLSQVFDEQQPAGPELRSCIYVAFRYSSLFPIVTLNSLQARVITVSYSKRKAHLSLTLMSRFMNHI